jgi:hypothetical protein
MDFWLVSGISTYHRSGSGNCRGWRGHIQKGLDDRIPIRDGNHDNDHSHHDQAEGRQGFLAFEQPKDHDTCRSGDAKRDLTIHIH